MQPISTPAEVPVDSPPQSALPESTAHSFSKEQFRHAVTAANLLAKRLKDQEEVVRRQKFHLLVLSSELKERKHNPLWVPGPTPEQQKEAWQKELAERARKASEQERWKRCEKKCKADEAFAMEIHIHALRSKNN
jgi:hypothetical protein